MYDRLIFCANDQAETTHSYRRNYNDEIIFACSVCGRELKFPARCNDDQLNILIATHNADNQGQIVIAPGGVGPADVYVAPGNHSTPEQIAVTDIQDAQAQLQAAPVAASPDLGPRAQEDLTDAEKAIWAGMHGHVQ